MTIKNKKYYVLGILALLLLIGFVVADGIKDKIIPVKSDEKAKAQKYSLDKGILRSKLSCTDTVCNFNLFKDGVINKELQVSKQKTTISCIDVFVDNDTNSTQCTQTTVARTDQEIEDATDAITKETLKHIADVKDAQSNKIKEIKLNDVEVSLQ